MIKIERTTYPPGCFDNPNLEKHIIEFSNSNKEFDWKILNYDEIESSLLDIYNTKCAYCESKLDKTEILHYRPFKGEYSCVGYKSLAYEWTNLLPVCPKCKELRGDKFPVISNRINTNSILLKDKRNAFISPLKDEERKILNPEIDNIDSNIYYNSEGEIQGNTKKAKHTISKECFYLNRLATKRKTISDIYIKRIIKHALRLVKGNISKSIYIEDISDEFKELENKKNRKSEFSGYFKYIYENFDKYIKPNVSVKEVQDEIINAFECFKKNEPIKTLYFEKLATNNLLTAISNKMSITGDGHISLQDINASTVTINYNNTEKLEEIITEFNQSTNAGHKYIAIELEKFFSRLQSTKTEQNETTVITEKFTNEVINFNTNLSLNIRELNKNLTLGIDSIIELLKNIINDIAILKEGQTEIKEKLDRHYQYLIEIPENSQKIIEIQQETNDLFHELNSNLEGGLTELLIQTFDYIDIHFEELDAKQQQIYIDLKKSDNWQTKIKLAVPLINLIGLKVEHEIKLNKLIKRIWKRK